MDTTKNINKIAGLNDEFRSRGQFMLTDGVLNVNHVISFVKAIESYDSFNEENDPYGEHDFGSLDWFGNKIFWKIDYYKQDLAGWGDPASPEMSNCILQVLFVLYM